MLEFGEAVGSTGGTGTKPVTCSGEQPEKTPAKAADEPGRVSGAQLCAALHRPDLAALLDTPGELAKNANGGGSTFKPVGSDKETHTPSAEVEFETYTVHLTASYDRLPVATSAALLGDGTPLQTVLGRPAAFYSDRTLSISFRLDGSKAQSRPGVPARVLMVARDASDGGDSFELTLWRADGAVPDDAVLLRVAGQVLPTVPGWAAAG
ncbi:DUF6215 domain-containing protein [Streptomyces sp. H34-S4]|uniref:DUF6215 domain-containing protein n=1 Tax=Streptomyces sp. H34-S4 TaxID=2996463 RepID=UPI00226F6F99|nr:DUF6215 domain-containing protein [Streptomyces sp. H34-S4]MCY0939387.1 DUF6215 domain-containing protein [Streptomyces sp. H34-S4]